MPLYEYTCKKCEQRFELLRSHGERDDACECTECGAVKKHRRVPSLFAAGVGDAGPSGGGLSSGSCSSSSSGFG